MVKFFFRIVWLGGLLLIPALGWADYEAGREAYDRGDYQAALKEWQPLARQRDVRVQHLLGTMYAEGHGVDQNDAEAVTWYRLAAEGGYAPAQFRLGFMYSQGRGVSQDYAEAAKWVRFSADQGDAVAQFNLGRMYFEGLGVARDWVMALMWTSLSADQGSEPAIEVREVLKERLRDDQIDEALRLSGAWKPKGHSSTP